MQSFILLIQIIQCSLTFSYVPKINKRNEILPLFISSIPQPVSSSSSISMPSAPSPTVIHDIPPFFPITIDEVANDASYYVKIALMNRYYRIRIDAQLKLLDKDRHSIRWLLSLAKSMLDEELTNIRIFVDTEYIAFCEDLIEAEMNEKDQNRLVICSISDESIGTPCKDKLFIIFKPNNLYCSKENENLLEKVQAICFKSALKRIPVLLVNPVLISTSYSSYGSTPSMLLGDFVQAYFIRDDYMMLVKSGQWCGLVRRLTAGCDLFLLEGMTANSRAPQKFTRLMHWAASTAMPDNLKSYIARLVAGEFNFGKARAVAAAAVMEEKRLQQEQEFQQQKKNSGNSGNMNASRNSNSNAQNNNNSNSNNSNAKQTQQQQQQQQSPLNNHRNQNTFISSATTRSLSVGEWRSTLPPPY